MRLLLVTSSPAWGGPATSLEKLALGLLERGHEVQFATTDPGLTARLSRLGPLVTRIGGRSVGPHQIRALLAVLRRMGAEAALADTARDLRLSACATLFHPVRLVYRYNRTGGRPPLNLVDRLCLTRVAACVYQSRWIEEAAAASARGSRRLRGYHVPNGYDTTRYAPRSEEGRRFRQSSGIAPGDLVVVTLGKLDREKGHRVAVEALARLHRNGAPIVYVVCGDGEQEGELRALARSLGLPARFTGPLDTDGVVAALSAADIVVHPSLTEIFPNAVGEAMACARPVVASDVGGTAELVGRDGSAGLLVPPADPAALAEAVDVLLADPPRRARLGAAARRRIESEFPLPRMIDGYERVLQDVPLPPD